MKLFLNALMALVLVPAISHAADIQIAVKTNENFPITAEVSYMSTSDSYLCTRSGEGYERQPKIFDFTVYPDAGNGLLTFNFDKNYDKCDSEINGLNLVLQTPKILVTESRYLSVRMVQGSIRKVQVIPFKKMNSPLSGISYYATVNEILVGSDGLAEVELKFEK